MPTSPDVTFTVFTPTYNRRHTLHRAYHSLAAQTCRDFEWLIIDDGSEDGTEALVKAWQKENRLLLRYLRRPHRGAHHAHQACLDEARGQFIIKLDSDDACHPEALATLHRHWLSIPPAQRPAFAGVTALCEDENRRLVGSPFPRSPLDCTAAELDYLHRVRGEKWGFVRADVLRRFPYPLDVPGHFIPESYIWSQVSRHYRTRHVNDRLRIYWTDAPSLVHGRPDPRRNAAGHRLMFQMVLNNEAAWFLRAPLRLLRTAAQFSRFAAHSGHSPRRQWQSLTGTGPRLLWLSALPLAALLLLRDAWRGRQKITPASLRKGLPAV